MESILTKFINSRYGAALAVLAMIAATYHAYLCGATEYITGDRGAALPSANKWFTPGVSELWVNIGVNILIMILMVVLNHRYRFIKAMSLLYVGFFAMMQLSYPDMMVQFYSGSVLAVVVLFCLSLLMDCFDSSGPMVNRKVFMIFCLISAGAMLQYAYVAYLPVFIIGCMQMRIFNFRVILAALTGVVTPWIIILGSGFVRIENLHLPQIASIFDAGDLMQLLSLVITLVLTVVLLWSAEILTLFKVLTYNAQKRACNGVLTVTAAVTTLMLLVDYTNITSYIPMLNVCAAFAVSHFFSFHDSAKTYIPVLSLYAVYLALYTWKLIN